MENQEQYRVSQLKVLKSAAGYYIGRVCIFKDGHEEPYSRESGYYDSNKSAEMALMNNDFFRA